MTRTRLMLQRSNKRRMQKKKPIKSKRRLSVQPRTLRSLRRQSQPSRLILRGRRKRPRREVISLASLKSPMIKNLTPKTKSPTTRSLKSRKNLLRPSRATSITWSRRRGKKLRNSRRSKSRTVSNRLRWSRRRSRKLSIMTLGSGKSERKS